MPVSGANRRRCRQRHAERCDEQGYIAGPINVLADMVVGMRSQLSALACVVAPQSGVLGEWARRHDEGQFSLTLIHERPDRIVLIDGSDRWRSLLLGAPPFLPSRDPPRPDCSAIGSR